MRIELSWKGPDDKFHSFETGCPKMAETMMRSSSDFPQVTAEIKQGFHERYGNTLGSFEQLLRDEMQKRPQASVNVKVSGLTVRITSNEEAMAVE